MVDYEQVSEFMATHARLLDRRRYQLLFGDGPPGAALGALSGYANPDGGFGWGLEPDLRAAASQPVGALHAFEVIEEVAAPSSPFSAALCDWLESVSRPDGGLPFALAGAVGPGTAWFFAEADTESSSLMMSALVCEIAHRAARHDRSIAEHPWLAAATDFCLRGIAALSEAGFALEFRAVLRLLDTLHAACAPAAAQLPRLAALLHPSATMAVAGGSDGERMLPLDFSPDPEGALRQLIDPAVIASDLDRLAGAQRPDGGWETDWTSFSPAASLEWRGYETVRALKVLRANRGGQDR